MTWPRKRVIQSCTKARGPLLTRYYLLDTSWFALYLHHLHASDEERAMHDHPWDFVTFLFSGGYWEHLPWCGDTKITRRHWRPRFSVLYRPAEFIHRVYLDRPVWTLVLRFQRRRRWGFWTKTGWMDWVSYGKEWCD